MRHFAMYLRGLRDAFAEDLDLQVAQIGVEGDGLEARNEFTRAVMRLPCSVYRESA